MSFRVVIARAAEDAIAAQVEYLKQQSAPPDRVDRWLTGLFDLIDSLNELPRRFPVAEAVTAAAGFEVRRVNYADYAVFFRVNDAQALVEVIAFRHGRQRPWLEAP